MHVAKRTFRHTYNRRGLTGWKSEFSRTFYVLTLVRKSMTDVEIKSVTHWLNFPNGINLLKTTKQKLLVFHFNTDSWLNFLDECHLEPLTYVKRHFRGSHLSIRAICGDSSHTEQQWTGHHAWKLKSLTVSK